MRAQPDIGSLNNPLYLSSHVWKDMESRTPVGCSHFFAWHLELCCDFTAYSQPEPSEHSSAEAAGCCLASRRNYVNPGGWGCFCQKRSFPGLLEIHLEWLRARLGEVDVCVSQGLWALPPPPHPSSPAGSSSQLLGGVTE